MTILQERLNVAGFELPYLPPGERVKVVPQRTLESYVLLDGTPGNQSAPAHATLFEVDGGEEAVDLATKLGLEAIYRAGSAFTLIETYSDPSRTSAWLGCILTTPPEFTEIGGSGRQLYRFKLTIQGGSP